jgi:presenilin-like A22 family membrane protease
MGETRRASKVRRQPHAGSSPGPFGAPPPPPDDDLESEPALSLFKKSGHSIPSMFLMFVLTIMAAVGILALQIFPKEYRAFGDDTNSVINPLIYVGIVLAFTAVILMIAKRGKKFLIRWIILGAVWLTLLYVFYPLFFYFIPYAWLSDDYLYHLIIDIPGTIALFLSIVLVYALKVHPEWYVVNIVGFLMGAGVIAIFGNSFSILPAMILLIALAVYDAIAVYKTKHMIDLADAVTEEHLPVVMVAPKRAGYSYVNEPGIKQRLEEGGERDAMFMGLGDIVIPGVMVASAFVFLKPWPLNLWVALGTLAGGLVGMTVLMGYVLKGNPQAGLPLLNGGVLGGFVLAYLAVYRDLTFGINFSF